MQGRWIGQPHGPSGKKWALGDRARRMHRSGLENTPAILAIGLVFGATDPDLWLAPGLMYGFVAARLAHFVADATRQTPAVGATVHTTGLVIVTCMALDVLWQMRVWQVLPLPRLPH